MRVLLFDLETAPNLGFTWAKYEQNVIDFEREWYVLCFAYKWLGESKVHAYSLPQFPLYKKDKENDKTLIEKLHALFDEADIIIGHNSDNFDIRKANARFAYHGMKPPSPYNTVDTKKVAKRYFSFNSNKLTDLGKHFGVGQKEDTGGFETWKGCMMGDKKAWNTMVSYNKQDVALLEKIYLILLPWIKTHPSVSIIDEKIAQCPNCGSTKVIRRGMQLAVNSKRPRYQCKDCGRWSVGSIIKNENIVH